jgi:hypothetical protein
MAVSHNLRRGTLEKPSRGKKHSMGVAEAAIFEKDGQATYVVLGVAHSRDAVPKGSAATSCKREQGSHTTE